MALWNHRWRTTERPHVLEGEFLARYGFALQFTKDKDVLDIGCGMGAGTNHIASNGVKRVLGVDYSKEAIEHAKRSFCLPNLEFDVMDATGLSLVPASFSVVIAFEVVEHLPPKYHFKFIESIVRLLEKDGICLISTPNKLVSSPGRSKPCNPYHTKEFEPQEFADLLERHFAEVSFMGLKCVRESYLRQQEEMRKSLKYCVTSRAGRYRLVRELLAFVPKGLKQRVTSEDKLPHLKPSDFKISDDDIESCEGLIAICQVR